VLSLIGFSGIKSHQIPSIQIKNPAEKRIGLSFPRINIKQTSQVLVDNLKTGVSLSKT